MSALSSLGRSKGSRVGTALAAGVVGGLVAGLVKIGWEAVLPPARPSGTTRTRRRACSSRSASPRRSAT